MIKLQLLLRDESRKSGVINRVREIAESLGMRVTTTGSASLSATVDETDFESLFGKKAQVVERRGPTVGDFGSPGGHASEDLTVPEALREHVQSISVAPPHTRMSKSIEGTAIRRRN